MTTTRVKNIVQRVAKLEKELSAKNRELQIESAVERVRAKALAMHKSEEILSVVMTLNKELNSLNIRGIGAATICLKQNDGTVRMWDLTSATVSGESIHFSTDITFKIKETDPKLWIRRIWDSKKKYAVIEQDEKDHRLTFKWTEKFNKEAAKNARKFIKVNKIKRSWHPTVPLLHGKLNVDLLQPPPAKMKSILVKMGVAFDLAYKRFLDLQKAEAQAREAQVEVAVERVRAKALAMHRSDEIHEVVRTLRHELFGIKLKGIVGATICLKQADGQIRLWDITDVEATGRYGWDIIFDIGKIDPRLWVKKIWDSKEQFIAIEQDSNDLNRTLKWLGQYDKKTADEILKLLKTNKIKHGWHRAVKLSEGILITDFSNEPPAEVKTILLKMGTAFDLAYKRFLDLQKAEAQARESQIQLSLERVRAKAMAMHHSDDLPEVLSLLFEQFDVLGIHPMYAQLNLFDLENNKFSFRCTGRAGQRVMAEQVVALDAMENWKDSVANFKKDKPDSVHCHEYPPEIIPQTFNLFKKIRDAIPAEALVHPEDFPDGLFITQGYCKFGYIGFGHNRKATEEEKTIVSKFSTEFGRVYQRFLDLQKVEAQAREAQIQLALERVRARTMAMHHSDELTDVVKLLYQEFDKLKISNESTDIEIGLIDEETGIASIWAHFYLSDGSITTFQFSLAQFIGTVNEYKIWKVTPIEKRNELFFTSDFSGKQWKKIIEWVNKSPELTEIFRPLMEAKITRWVTHNAYFSHGMLTLQGTEPYSAETQEIQKRFTKVFEQTYTRFLDLKKAEAQTREKEIELGLERVRARAMAMQRSDELSDLIETVFKELTKLDFALKWCIINIIDEPSLTNTVWAANPDINKAPESYHMKFEDYPFHHAMLKGYQERNAKCVYVIEGEEKKIYDEYLFNQTEFRKVPPEAQAASRAMERYVVTFSFSNFGGLQTVGDAPLSEASLDILSRFGKVFDLTYTRFNDLRLAEAQAREAQIEAALERVRSRSMGMQKSEELKEVIKIVYQQLIHLNIKLDHAGFVVDYKPGGDWHFWIADERDIPSKISHPYFESVWANQFNEAKEKGADFFVTHLNFEEKNKFYHELLSYVPGLPEASKDFYLSCPALAATTVIFNNIGLYIENFSGVPYTDEENKILFRFGKVFEQTYTRFLDLQRAEAQARESQIQLALERVRARAMAMHHTDELSEVLSVLFDQFDVLGISPMYTFLSFIDLEKNNFTYRQTGRGGKRVIAQQTIDLNAMDVWKDAVERWKASSYDTVETMFVPKELVPEVFKVYKEIYDALPEDAKVYPEDFPGGMYATIAASKFGHLGYDHNRPSTEEEKSILLRFNTEFVRLYQRFLDLQKAEAQAREAKIEAALERTRTQSMIMQHSNELDDTLRVFHQQVLLLGIPSAFSFLWLPDEEKDRHIFWAVWAENNSKNFSSKAIDYPLDRNEPATAQCLVDWKSKEPVVSYHVPPVGVESYFAAWQELIAGVDQLKPEYFSDGLYYVEAFMKYGCFGVMVKSELKEDEKKILARFAIEFERAYTRFLDLQNAEAQAREAQIEASLERVRAKAMAMHKSEDLNSVVATVFEELGKLNPGVLRCGVGIFNKAKRTGNIWSSTLSKEGTTLQISGDESFDIHPLLSRTFDSWLEQKEFSYELEGDDLDTYYKELTKTNFNLPETQSKTTEKEKRRQYYYTPMFDAGNLYAFSEIPFSEDAKKIMRRFATVLNLTYNRFLDLQKAEAQAREAQIEAALEKVRSRSLAMHKSDELQEVVNTVFERLKDLNIEMDSANIAIFKEGTKDFDYWIASPVQKRSASFHMPYIDLSLTRDLVAARESGMDFSAAVYSFEEKNEWFNYGFKNTDFKFLSEERKQFILAAPAIMIAIAFSRHTGIQVNRYSTKLLSEGEAEILKRFSKVFEQAYIRFLDLEKAEAQAKEAQIEVSLERVRAKAMAMHSSKDLAETIGVFYRELKSLSVIPIRCGVALMDKNTRVAELTTMNTTEQGDSIEVIGKIKMSGHSVLDGVFENWLVQKEYHAVLRGNQIKEYYQVLKPQISYPDYSHDDIQFGYYFMFNEGDVYAWTETELSEHDLSIYRRFTSVISLTYKRYKDLQQAEAQAREAQIEASLERVRARTMAMHSSEDVIEATVTMFTELEKLGIQNLRCGIANFNLNRTMEVWSVSNVAEGKKVTGAGMLDIDSIPFWKLFYSGWERKEDFFHYRMQGEEKEDYFRRISAIPHYLSQGIQGFPDMSFQSYYFPEGSVWTFSLDPHSDADKQLMKRFASVFSLTFRRYQDLKKAEAQTREATIEAALERVRGKAMAMHSSKDLATTIGVFYHELTGLSLTPRRCGVGLLNKENRAGELFTWNTTSEGDSLELVGKVKMEGHPVLENIYNNWLTQAEYHPILRGNEIKEYYKVIRPQMAFPDYDLDTLHYGYFFYFEEGGVYAWTEKELHEDELKIYRRFTSVLSLTYKRYKDLKDAEARAQNAIKEAALDRIRADIASMRTVEDLDRITPLIWNELTILGIPFIRCGVFIMDDDQQLIHTFLSTPDGKAIAAFHLPYDTQGNLNQVISNWKVKKKYIDHWDESEFTQFAEILVKQGSLTSAEQYLKTIPKGGFHLHFLPFLQGMLYVGNTDQLNDEQIELIGHVAGAFSTAYARYEDFNKLEVAKQQVENTLSELKQAQQQLVQSEKMASLGELTAGIAHEIQNPLNFVNNFSDVSNELLEEMKQELATGNMQQAIDIVNDVKDNLEKILHHGKRADAIVKGMLQHSRTSSGQKELTDINMLADEYLRLAYHGLRAKDKSFNAKFETQFDNSIGKISIIPQDVGRVILNLINNAFYTVTEKKKHASAGSAPNGYEPTVTVTTKKENGRIEIKVRDNGSGIPQKVLDKIFQPFFTTKPTGQGTGLGLSLAYDIITKGHGGELRVDTKEGEGSEFIIQLPIN